MNIAFNFKSINLNDDESLKKIKDIFSRLHENDNNIFIIIDKNISKNKVKRYFEKKKITNFLKKNNIYFNHIIWNEDSSEKKDICLRNCIDVLVEDNISEAIYIASNCNIDILFNGTKEEEIEKNKIHKIAKIEDVPEKIKNIFQSKQMKIKKEDVIKPISGNPSIDKNWLQFYPYKLRELKENNLTLYEFLLYYNMDHLDIEAINYFGKRLTFKEFFDKIDDCAKAFQHLGVKSGDIVPICMPNTPEAIISIYALNKLGAVADMLFPLSSKEEFKNYLQEVNSEKPFVMVDLIYEQVKDTLKELNFKNVIVASVSETMPVGLKLGYKISQKIKQFIKKNNLIEKTKLSEIISEKEKKEIKKIYTSKIDFKGGVYKKWSDFIKLSKKEKTLNFQPFEKGRKAIIVHTGGTTGVSKGVVLTNENINSYVEQFRMNGGNFKIGDKMLAIMPIFHGFGLCSSIHIPLCFGVSTVLIPKVDNSKVDELFTKYKPNYIIGVPTFWKAILNNEKLKGQDLSYVKYLVTGGDAITENLENSINEFFESRNSKANICKGYGLSEAVAGVTYSFDDCNKKGSIGIPMFGNDFKIVDIDTNSTLGYNQEGEFCISGPTIMKEYLNNPKETEMITEIDKNGKKWLHTGDMGYIDENGILYYTQRKKRMIVSSGHNVYPKQIEDVICSNENVESCVVIGLKHNYKGSVPKAYIVLKKGIKLDKNVIFQIKESCSKNLSTHSVPSELEFIDSEALPETKYGKIDYRALTEMANKKEKVLTLRKTR